MIITVGIDVAKEKHDCFILSSEGEALADVFTIQNNAEGFNQLLQVIQSCASPIDKMKVGLEAMETSRCKSRSKFIEEAVQFYAGYISGQDANAYLPPALVSALNATLHSMEDRICRLLFKLSVEMDMMMNVLAAGMEIPAEQLDRLRPQCVRNVKKTSGSISLDSAVERQER